MRAKLHSLQCKRCGHKWFPRRRIIVMCPKCKSPNWAKEKDMTQEEKYEAILEMRSIEEYTLLEHPTKSAFKTALREGRVGGRYNSRIVIVSDDPRKSYTFISDKPCECFNCGWRGQGSGNGGKLIEGDRCQECGEYL